MTLHIEPETLESQAIKIETLGTEFAADLDTEQSNVQSLDWDGQTAAAFTTLFEETRTQLRDVEEQIANIASLLRSAKDGLIDADDQIAAGLQV